LNSKKSKNKNMIDKRQLIIAFTLLTLTAASAFAASHDIYPDSNLSPEGQKALQRAVSAMAAKNYPRAHEAIEAATSSATDAKGCIYIMSALNAFGGSANKIKRPAVEKALSLATTSEDILAVANFARQCEMYDLSKSTIDKLVSTSDSFNDLMNISHQAHEAAMADSVHLALQKAYTLINNEPDALEFIRQSHSLGMDQLTRKASKDLIEDQTTTTELVSLTTKLEPLEMSDLVRDALIRGLDKAKAVSDYVAVFESAKHFEQEDIVKLAKFRGRKLGLINKIKGEADSTPAAVADQQRRSKEEVNRSTLAKPSGF